MGHFLNDAYKDVFQCELDLSEPGGGVWLPATARTTSVVSQRTAAKHSGKTNYVWYYGGVVNLLLEFDEPPFLNANSGAWETGLGTS